VQRAPSPELGAYAVEHIETTYLTFGGPSGHNYRTQ
jgi:hypothetical protein